MTINLGELSEDHHISEEDYCIFYHWALLSRYVKHAHVNSMFQPWAFPNLKRLGEGKIPPHNFAISGQMRMKLGMGIILWVEICSNW